MLHFLDCRTEFSASAGGPLPPDRSVCSRGPEFRPLQNGEACGKCSRGVTGLICGNEGDLPRGLGDSTGVLYGGPAPSPVNSISYSSFFLMHQAIHRVLVGLRIPSREPFFRPHWCSTGAIDDLACEDASRIVSAWPVLRRI